MQKIDPQQFNFTTDFIIFSSRKCDDICRFDLDIIPSCKTRSGVVSFIYQPQRATLFKGLGCLKYRLGGMVQRRIKSTRFYHQNETVTFFIKKKRAYEMPEMKVMRDRYSE